MRFIGYDSRPPRVGDLKHPSWLTWWVLGGISRCLPAYETLSPILSLPNTFIGAALTLWDTGWSWEQGSAADTGHAGPLHSYRWDQEGSFHEARATKIGKVGKGSHCFCPSLTRWPCMTSHFNYSIPAWLQGTQQIIFSSTIREDHLTQVSCNTTSYPM